jgi:hypothetical protein
MRGGVDVSGDLKALFLKDGLEECFGNMKQHDFSDGLLRWNLVRGRPKQKRQKKSI